MNVNTGEKDDGTGKLNRAAGLVLFIFFLGAFSFPGDISAASGISAGLPLDAGQNSVSRVEELVRQFPAPDTAQRDRLSAELLRLGKKGILDICRMLLTPEKGDDTQARYAVNALSSYVMQKGLEREREKYTEALIEALENHTEKEVQAFLLGQLQRTGKEESVKPLRKYLRDRRLCEPAAQALLAIGTPDAEKALLKALKDAPDENRIPLVKALGELRSNAAVKKIVKWADSPDDGLREVTLFALANIGDPGVEEVIDKVSLAAPSYERIKAPSRYLLYARRLAESGHRMKAVNICRRLIENYTAPQETHITCTALSLLVDVLGEGSFEDLLSAVDSPNRALRARALELAGGIPDEAATRRWVEKMEEVPAEVQVQIIAMLGNRGDKAALPILRQKMKSHRKVVRLAAVPAAAKLGGTVVFSDFITLLGTDQEDEVAAVKQALLGYPSDLLIPKAVKIIEKVPPLSRVALIEILSERYAKEHAAVVFAQACSDEDDVRGAALAGLENLAGERDMARLIEMLLYTEDSREIRLLQNALVAGANHIEDREERADCILEALEKADEEKQIDLLRPLSRIGGKRALQAVIARTRSENSRIQTTAVSVLADWPEFDAAEELFEICRSAEDQKHLLVAVRGYVRLIGDSDLEEEEKVKRYREILRAAS